MPRGIRVCRPETSGGPMAINVVRKKCVMGVRVQYVAQRMQVCLHGATHACTLSVTTTLSGSCSWPFVAKVAATEGGRPAGDGLPGIS